MNRMINAAAFVLLATPLFAQDTQELALQYSQMPEIQKMMDEMFSPASMSAQLAASLPPGTKMTTSQKTRIGEIMSKALGGLRPRLEEIMVASSAETFSADELKALIAFYSSEHGASVMTKMSPFMASVMGSLAPEMQAAQAKMAPQIIEIMQE
ncbi:DUF2059 domain-containing protein [uncultured Sulfitobacter sp.]|uniref:DUF2059 domain-containing protein n=1 Tax=uncultured Sulfitobacter sp. TaxID=191468 RepID=UPI002620EB29|nr:DUF2059 domain-containing protein [uncultured Sulfitobacter sp.]